eukprot:515766-Rhodomonas_salina.1
MADLKDCLPIYIRKRQHHHRRLLGDCASWRENITQSWPRVMVLAGILPGSRVGSRTNEPSSTGSDAPSTGNVGSLIVMVLLLVTIVDDGGRVLPAAGAIVVLVSDKGTRVTVVLLLLSRLLTIASGAPTLHPDASSTSPSNETGLRRSLGRVFAAAGADPGWFTCWLRGGGGGAGACLKPSCWLVFRGALACPSGVRSPSKLRRLLPSIIITMLPSLPRTPLKGEPPPWLLDTPQDSAESLRASAPV